MIDMFDLYKSFRSYVNTYVGGWYRPQTDFTQACVDINTKLFVKWTGEAEKSQEAKDNLSPFLLSTNITLNQKGPYATGVFPKDYSRFGTARIIVSEDQVVDPTKTQDQVTSAYFDSLKQIQVEMVDDKKWGAVNAHLTKGPTLCNPKMRQIISTNKDNSVNNFQVAPRSVSVIVLDYYRQPKIPTFVYTTSVPNLQTGEGDEIVYNKTGSQPLEWPENVRNEFLIELGSRYGLFSRDQFVSQVTAQQKQTA